MLKYHDLLAATAIRTNSLIGTTPVAMQIAYSTRPLTDEMFDGSIVPMNAIRDAIIECEGKLANTIALSSNRTLRAYLQSFTNTLTSGDFLPDADINGTPIIGNFGACYDASNNSQMLTRKSVPYVQTILQSPLNYLVPLYHYALDVNRIIHTTALAFLECCVYSAEEQTRQFDANEALLLPDSLAEVYINGAMALLIRDDEWLTQATQYANYFSAFLATLPPAVTEQQAA